MGHRWERCLEGWTEALQRARREVKETFGGSSYILYLDGHDGFTSVEYFKTHQIIHF
jgi:hypothetical protein